MPPQAVDRAEDLSSSSGPREHGCLPPSSGSETRPSAARVGLRLQVALNRILNLRYARLRNIVRMFLPGDDTCDVRLLAQ